MCAANVESMGWVGDVSKDRPWHMTAEKIYGYGGDSPISAAAMMELSGLDWRVAPHPAAVEIQGRIFKSDEYSHIVRDSDCKILGTVTGRYTPIQNSEAFDFLDTLVQDLAALRYVTAGSIDGGKRVWMLAQLVQEGMSLEPLLGDKVNSYLMVTTGHDGKSSLKCKFTTVRIVCQNTLNLALRTGDEGISIRHIGDPKAKVRQAREILGLATQEIEEFRRVSSWLANLKADRIYMGDFLEHMAPTEGKGDKAITRAENIQKELGHLANFGKGTHIPGVAGSRWSLLNAVTEYNSHHRNFRDTKESGADSNKFDALFSGGVGERMNQKALDFLLQDAPDSVYKPAKRKALELA